MRKEGKRRGCAGPFPKEQAHRLLANGAQLISTNADTWCPTDSGPRPGCGAIVALLEAASGKTAYPCR